MGIIKKLAADVIDYLKAKDAFDHEIQEKWELDWPLVQIVLDVLMAAKLIRIRRTGPDTVQYIYQGD